MNNPTEESAGVIVMVRRRFLTAISLGLGGLTAALVSLPALGFLFGSLFQKPGRAWRPVGPLEKFNQGETVLISFTNAMALPWDGVTARRSAWLRRENGEQFVAFAINCTHLGCPVRWDANANLFMCPCHGGVYYSNGEVAGGPPPRPLSRLPVRIRDGQVEIETASVLTS